jgi:serine/threonine protein kinase
VEDPTLFGDIEREVAMCTALRSPFIVTFFGRATQPGKFFLVMEFVEHGSLGSLVKKGPLDRAFKIRALMDTARGMEFLHRNKILHRDLKTDNVLISSMDVRAAVVGKLSDFGTSRFAGSDAARTKTKGVGTPIFMAPEILANQKYDMRADVFSFGVMCWHVWTQQEPYAHFDNQFAIYRFIDEGKRLAIPDDMPAALREVTDASWAHDQARRPSFIEIVPKIEALLT